MLIIFICFSIVQIYVNKAKGKRVKMKRLLFIMVAVIISIICFPVTARADMGPKSSLEIIVSNPPKGQYYLDLLVDYNGKTIYKSIINESKYDADKIKILKEYRYGNWRPALLTGTRYPMHGELIGTPKGNKMVHKFSYFGVPDRFKIIILTSDNKIIVSNEIHKKTFNSTVYYNFKTNSAKERPIILSCLLQFLFTCSCTLVIEGIILLLFRFSIKQNWKPFLTINIITQIFLNFILSVVMFTHGLLTAYILYIPLELIILIAEIICFRKYLNQHTKLRRTLYAITANVVSFVLGFPIMSMIYKISLKLK